MKVLVSSFSGNVGKTTISSQLLAPMLGAELLMVESINSTDGAKGDTITGDQLDKLLRKLLRSKKIVVDCGSSNIEVFLKSSEEYGNVPERFDYIVIPTIPDRKQVADTVKTVETFMDLGVPQEKIRVIVNRAANAETAMAIKTAIVAATDLPEKQVVLLPDSKAFSRCSSGTSIFELAADETDFAALSAETEDEDAQDELIEKEIIREVARTTAKRMEKCFSELELA